MIGVGILLNLKFIDKKYDAVDQVYRSTEGLTMLMVEVVLQLL